MMKNLFLSLILLSWITAAYSRPDASAGGVQADTSRNLVFDVGGKSIDFTLPDTAFIEAGRRYSSVFNLFVPDANRLICGFLTTGDVKKIEAGKDPEMKCYILVEVNREAEYRDCKPENFKEVAASVGDVTKMITATNSEVMKEVNDKISSLNIGDIQVNDPKNLGVLMSRKDAVASGILFKVQQGSSAQTFLCSMLLIRLQDRLIFIYLYKIFEGQATVREIARLTDQFAIALLAANPSVTMEEKKGFWEGLPGWVKNALIGGGAGLLFALVSSAFRRKKPEVQPETPDAGENLPVENDKAEN